MDPGKALVASLEIIRELYETVELYRRLETINGEILNEIALLVSLQDQIVGSQRMKNNPVVDNYLADISRKLTKIRRLVSDVGDANMLKKIIYTKKIKKISGQVAQMVKKLKVLLELKREMTQSSRLDVANIISDTSGCAFWEKTFGSDNLFVQQNMFFGALRLHTNLLATEIDFLKKVVNDDRDKFISAFEFQEWIDFFGGFDVVMKRTIESLLDPGTYDVVSWYHPELNKNLVKSYLYDNPFIVRKHATQKGVFIVNYCSKSPLRQSPLPLMQPPLIQTAPSTARPPSPYMDIHAMYVKNEPKQGVFSILTPAGMSGREIEIQQKLDMTAARTLCEITARLETVLRAEEGNPVEIEPRQTWEQARTGFLDADIFDSAKKKFMDAIPTPTSVIASVSEGVTSIFNCFGGRVPHAPSAPR